MPDEELDQILEELKNDDSLTTLNDSPSAEQLDISDKNVNDFIMQKVGKLVESGIETIEAIQQTISTGFEPEELNAFSGLLASVTHAADVLNKVNIQNKKAASNKELKEMEIKSKLQLNAGSQSGTTNNVLIATREEVIERFLEKNQKVIEADTTESNDIDE